MPVYEWTAGWEFHDNRNDRVIESGDTVELDAEVAEGHREFVEVEADDPEGDSGDEGSVDVSEFSGKDWQSLAASYEFEDVNGQSSAEDIRTAFEDLSEEEQAAALEAFDGE